jgi:hypothetical protein
VLLVKTVKMLTNPNYNSNINQNSICHCFSVLIAIAFWHMAMA